MLQSKTNRQASSMSGIKVFIRVRPLVNTQKDTNQVVEVQSDNKTLKIYNNSINHIQSKFDHVFTTSSTQQQVFQHFSPSIQNIFNGFNLTIFAYGQTGSGKTFTMFGKDWQNYVDKFIVSKKQSQIYHDSQNLANSGIIPRSINVIFSEYEKHKGRFQLFCSFLQIYNEKIYDLLQDSSVPKALNIHESKINGIFVQGLTEFQVQNLVDCLKLMRQGEKNRFVRETTMNAKSSRSHSIFQILIESTTSDEKGNFIKARLNLCDLAGSEKIQKGQNLQNEHLQELKNINLSLTTLGKVINSLSSGKKASVAAFRESKLTRLLQQSLTVNTNTFIIGNVSPSSQNIDQTINTLKFAERASHITMKVKPLEFNELNPDAVSKLKKQVQYLKSLLSSKKQGIYQFNEQQYKDQNTLKSNQDETISQVEFQKLLIENRKMKKEIFQLQNNLQKIKYQTSSMNSSAYPQNSASSRPNSQQQISTHKSLRKQVYLQKFLKKVPQNEQSKKQNRNHSVFVITAKATLQHKIQNKNMQKLKSQQMKQEKLQILKKFQLMERNKIKNQKMIIEELQNLKNFNSVDKKGLVSQRNQKQIIPHRYHQANVFRRGKINSQLGQIYNSKNIKQTNQIFTNKKKVDYSLKIKQLQQRLFNK